MLFFINFRTNKKDALTVLGVTDEVDVVRYLVENAATFEFKLEQHHLQTAIEDQKE